MHSFSSAAGKPGRKSTAIPRAARISAARGLKASAISAFDIYGSGRRIHHRDSETARVWPFAAETLCLIASLWIYAAFAAWRCSSRAQSNQGSSNATSAGSIVAPVQIRTPGGEAWGRARAEAPPSSSSRFVIARAVRKRSSQDIRANHGSTISICGEVEEIVAGSSARNRTQAQVSTQALIVARLCSERATSPSSPPTDSAHFSESSASSTHSIDGVLIVSPRKTPSINLPFLVNRKSLGKGQGGV